MNHRAFGLIKEKDLQCLKDIINVLKRIRKRLVTNDNIKNIIFRPPGDNIFSKTYDISIRNATLKQIAILKCNLIDKNESVQ